jgi:hypothetical protein
MPLVAYAGSSPSLRLNCLKPDAHLNNAYYWWSLVWLTPISEDGGDTFL